MINERARSSLGMAHSAQTDRCVPVGRGCRSTAASLVGGRSRSPRSGSAPETCAHRAPSRLALEAPARGIGRAPSRRRPCARVRGSPRHRHRRRHLTARPTPSDRCFLAPPADPMNTPQDDPHSPGLWSRRPLECSRAATKDPGRSAPEDAPDSQPPPGCQSFSSASKQANNPGPAVALSTSTSSSPRSPSRERQGPSQESAESPSGRTPRERHACYLRR